MHSGTDLDAILDNPHHISGKGIMLNIQEGKSYTAVMNMHL